MLLHVLKTNLLHYFINFLRKVLPPKTKRLIFLTSLTARIKDTDVFDVDTVRKLNHVMSLAHRDSELTVPVSLNRVIWHNQTACNILNIDNEACIHNLNVNGIDYRDTSNVGKMSDSVISLMPDWLLYADINEIKHDVIQLLSNYNKIIAL